MNSHEVEVALRLYSQLMPLAKLINTTKRYPKDVDPEALRRECSKFLDHNKLIIRNIKELESSLTRTVEQLEAVSHVKQR